MAACTAVWNGMFGRIILQHLGITLVLLCFYGLVASFLPSSLSWACWIFGAFSLFSSKSIKPLPKKVAKLIISLQRDFLWGRHSDSKKIAWLKWEVLCLPKERGGLGLLNPQSFNIALLSKWIWRFLSPEDSLWKRLIISRHGAPRWTSNGITLVRNLNRTSGWWKKIWNLIVGDGRNWFWDLVERKLGNGNDTEFWEGPWCGSPSLKLRFPRLFHLSSQQDAKVGNMGLWVNGVWRWNLLWRRELRDSESFMVQELLRCLSHQPRSTDELDHWGWKGKSNAAFSVKFIYATLEKNSLSRLRLSQNAKVFSSIWKSSATFKAQTLGWRLIWNRLPTCDNLIKRIDIPGLDQRCCYCRAADETCHHLFIECPMIRDVWNDLSSWIGVLWAAPNSVAAHFGCFSALLGGGKCVKNLAGLWICTA